MEITGELGFELFSQWVKQKLKKVSTPVGQGALGFKGKYTAVIEFPEGWAKKTKT